MVEVCLFCLYRSKYIFVTGLLYLNVKRKGWRKLEQGVYWRPFFHLFSSKKKKSISWFSLSPWHNNTHTKILINHPHLILIIKDLRIQLKFRQFRTTSVNSSDLSWKYLQLNIFLDYFRSILSVCGYEKVCTLFMCFPDDMNEDTRIKCHF